MPDRSPVEREQRPPEGIGAQAGAELRNGRSVFVRDEIALARSAHGAEPGVGDVLERGPGRNAAVRITVVGVVDVAAGLADPALQGLGRSAHTQKITWL